MILGEIHQTYEDYLVLPHYGLIADWFVRYWDLAELCFKAYGLEMKHKPKLTKLDKDSVQK